MRSLEYDDDYILAWTVPRPLCMYMEDVDGSGSLANRHLVLKRCPTPAVVVAQIGNQILNSGYPYPDIITYSRLQ